MEGWKACVSFTSAVLNIDSYQTLIKRTREGVSLTFVMYIHTVFTSSQEIYLKETRVGNVNIINLCSHCESQ